MLRSFFPRSRVIYYSNVAYVFFQVDETKCAVNSAYNCGLISKYDLPFLKTHIIWKHIVLKII